MAPIPIYSQSPINATKADGVTPQTRAARPNDDGQASTTTTTTTARYAPAPAPAPPPAQPGAVPRLPEPTGVVTAPTATTKTAAQNYDEYAYNAPPPPQPGAVPVPTRTTSNPPPVLPPPPKVGETLRGGGGAAKTTTTGAPPPMITTAMPPQMAMPPPLTSSSSAAYPGASRGTATDEAALLIAADHRVLDHPPGYIQNAYATDMDSSQREAARAAAKNSTGSGMMGEETESLWDAAKKLAATAGDRLQAAESEVWRRINKE